MMYKRKEGKNSSIGLEQRRLLTEGKNRLIEPFNNSAYFENLGIKINLEKS